MSTIKPLGSKILVSPPIRPQQAGIIAIPQQYQDDDRHRQILAVGPKVTDLKAGDRVICELYSQYTNLEDGTDRCIIDRAQVILVALPES